MPHDVSNDALINNLQQAEKDLEMYAAIVGFRPAVEMGEAVDEASVSMRIVPVNEGNDSPSHRPRRINLWMRQVSQDARRRIHEAKLRLAS